MARRRTKARSDTIVGKLKPADPFELIRWLARSQPDPRKALAELVQNSIDAGAREIRLTRARERGVTALHILDDGDGVIPEMERPDALTYIATHVGHSRKAQLTPEQRRELMLQGKYGIGLLGFWAIGQSLEMRSQVPGQTAHVLRLFEDSSRYEVDRYRSRLQLGERFTEVVVRGLHRPAFVTLTGRRMADYLAAELRGQLLEREVRILVHDKIGRGRAPKLLEVKPKRFEGQRLPLPEQIDVAGYAPLAVELYLLPAGEESEVRVSVSAAGTLVYDDVCEYEAADFRRPPWTDRRLSGLLEFRDFQVPPGSRRGVMPDDAAAAFAVILRSLEDDVRAQLREAEERAAAAVDADLLKQLQRAFRDLPRLAPEYDFFGVQAREEPPETPPATGAPDGAALAGESGPGAALPASAVPPGSAETGPGESDLPAADEDRQPSLLPAGPLASLRVLPERARLPRLGARTFRADARDAAGVRIDRALVIEWSAEPEAVTIEPTGERTALVRAGEETGASILRAVVREGGEEFRAEADIEIVDELDAGAARAGIPEPVFVHEPYGAWRSRLNGERWEVNSGHPDFLLAAETGRRKLRYIASLLAKEVVLHSFPMPQLGPTLERLVSVMAMTERRLERG